MPRYIAALTTVLMIAMVVTRVLILRRTGIAAMQFGKFDKTDFLIPPFALFYFYLDSFGLYDCRRMVIPTPSVTRRLFEEALQQRILGVFFASKNRTTIVHSPIAQTLIVLIGRWNYTKRLEVIQSDSLANYQTAADPIIAPRT